MKRLKIAVVEDEVLTADNLCGILQDLGYETCEPSIGYTDALETIQNESPDLIILDIQLSGKKDGIDLAHTIKDQYGIPFMYLTSHSDSKTIERAKKTEPLAFLVKPFSKSEIFASIEIAFNNYESKEEEKKVVTDAIFIKHKHLFIKIKLEDILFIKADHVYAEIYMRGKQKFLQRASLNEFIEKLDSNFYRIHRGYIVNLKHISAIEPNTVCIIDHKIPIGKNYKEGFLKKVNMV